MKEVAVSAFSLIKHSIAEKWIRDGFRTNIIDEDDGDNDDDDEDDNNDNKADNVDTAVSQ